MKPKHLVLPIIALVIAGILLGTQRRNVSELRAGNAELRGRIATARQSGSFSVPTLPRGPGAPGQTIGWDKIASLLREHPAGNAPAMISIKRQLLAMDSDELLAGLDGIAAMGLDEETRDQFELLILDPLCKKDPEAALERFKGNLRDRSGLHRYFLSSALNDWTKRDLPAATAWLDREIAAGTFEPRSLDGNDGIRTRFESAVVFGQFAADPSKAEARLSELPSAMRADILRQADGFHKMGMEDEIALAEISRRQLEREERVAAIAGRAEKVIGQDGDFAAVDEYLDKVQAAPDERERSAETVARRYVNSLAAKKEVSAAGIDAMRAWVSRDAPGSADRLTGEALAKGLTGGGGMDFAETAALALKYHQSSGNDKLLYSFLGNIPATDHKPEARALAERISDPENREIWLRKFD